MTIDFLKITLPLLSAVLAWLANEWRERVREDYLRKENLYRSLLDAMQGFYEAPAVPSATYLLASGQSAGKQDFLNQVRLAWLYSPDDVILTAYAFLDTVHTDRNPAASSREKEIALGNVVEAVRRDLFRHRYGFLRKTKLTGAQFRHVRPN